MYANRQLGMFGYYGLVFKKYAQFSGRSTRSEFWYFHLVNLLIGLAFCFLLTVSTSIDAVVSSPDMPVVTMIIELLYLIYFVILFIPSLALAWRRLHDTNRSGCWWFLCFTYIGIIPLIIFWCQKSDIGANRFGEATDTVEDRNIIQTVQPAVSENQLEMIEKLADLKAKGVLTEEEFQRKKTELL